MDLKKSLDFLEFCRFALLSHAVFASIQDIETWKRFQMITIKCGIVIPQYGAITYHSQDDVEKTVRTVKNLFPYLREVYEQTFSNQISKTVCYVEAYISDYNDLGITAYRLKDKISERVVKLTHRNNGVLAKVQRLLSDNSSRWKFKPSNAPIFTKDGKSEIVVKGISIYANNEVYIDLINPESRVYFRTNGIVDIDNEDPLSLKVFNNSDSKHS